MYDAVYVAHSALHARAAHGEVQVRNMIACKIAYFRMFVQQKIFGRIDFNERTNIGIFISLLLQRRVTVFYEYFAKYAGVKDAINKMF